MLLCLRLGVMFIHIVGCVFDCVAVCFLVRLSGLVVRLIGLVVRLSIELYGLSVDCANEVFVGRTKCLFE